LEKWHEKDGKKPDFGQGETSFREGVVLPFAINELLNISNEKQE